MQKIYINYANDDFNVQQESNSQQARNIGKVERVISYSPDDIDKDFYNTNKKILNKVRGGGYWLWKFYFIHKILTDETLKDGDVIFYADSGTDVLKDLTPVFDLPAKYNSDIILFSYGVKCREFTKRDAFILMDCDENGAYEFPMCAGGFNVWRKSYESIKFIEQCIEYGSDFNIIGDRKSKLGDDLPEFEMHRHDQCIFSLVAYKNKLKIISAEDENICGYEQDGVNPNTFFKHKRSHNRGFWRKKLYKIAMLPEKFQKYGGFFKYLIRQFLYKGK